MTKLISVLRDHFVFTTDRHLEAHYFDRPVFESRRFRINTIAMLCALLIGTFVLGRFWLVLPWDSRWLVLVSMLCLLGVWERTIRDHRKVQQRIRSLPRDEVSGDLLRAAAGAANFAPYLLYIVTFALIVALGLAAK